MVLLKCFMIAVVLLIISLKISTLRVPSIICDSLVFTLLFKSLTNVEKFIGAFLVGLISLYWADTGVICPITLCILVTITVIFCLMISVLEISGVNI